MRILRHVAHLSVFHPSDRALGGLQVASQHLHERGLADTVGADDGDALTRFHVEADVLQHGRVRARIGERHLLHTKSVTVELLRLFEPDVRVLTRRRTNFFQLDLVELLLARSSLTRLRGIRGEATHEFLQFRDAVGGLGIGSFNTLAGLHRGQHEVVVVARVDLQLLEVQVRHVRAHLVQEVAIMADDDHGGVGLVQHTLQPMDGVNVQVVGGLVQQQDVGVGKQRLRQQYAQL